MPRGPASCPQSRGRLPVGYTPIWPGGAPEARRETPGSSAPSVTEQVRDDDENRQPRRRWLPRSVVGSKSHESTPLGATLRRASLPPAPRSPASAGGARALCAATSDPGLGGVCRHRELPHRSSGLRKGSRRPDARRRQGRFLLRLQGRTCSRPFPASGGAHTPRLMAPSSVLNARSPGPALPL